MSKITTENEHVARLQLTWRPSRDGDPFRLDAVVLSVDGDIHLVAAADDFEAAVFYRGGVDGEEDGQVFDFPDVRVGG